MSLKNPVTPPGIDPGTVRLVVQRLNHCATPSPYMMEYHSKYAVKTLKLIFRTKFKYWKLNFKSLSTFCSIPIKALKKMFISPPRWVADCVFTSCRSFAFITSVEFWEALSVKKGCCSLLLHQVASKRSVCFVNGVLLCIVTRCNILCNYTTPLRFRQDFGWQNE